MIYKVKLKVEDEVKDTSILVEAEDEKSALQIFKQQRLYEKGISKKDFIVEKA